MFIPNVLEKKNNYERVYDLDSKMLEDRIVFINGEIEDNNADIESFRLLIS